MTRIDEAVGRILRVKYELGLFENPMPLDRTHQVGSAESRQVSLEAARESMTLLKNDNNILPLSKNKKVLVTGPTADSLISLNNGWTWVWQGSEPSLYPNRPTIRQAIAEKVGSKNFNYVPGTRIVRPPNSPSNSTPTDINEEVDIPAAVNAAKKSDVVVLCLGEGSYTETPGNITDLTLAEPQLRLAEAIAATGKPIVLVLVEGRPRIFSRVADRMQGILMAFNPSSEGGIAIADVLFGDYNPGGKLPFTYPRTTSSQITYDHKDFEVADTSFGNAAFKPQFEFGQGLSYTTFDYSNLRLSSKTMPMNGEITVNVTVTNTGNRAGKESAILYVRDVVASIAPPGKRVKRFAKVYLEPGQSKNLTFKLNKEDLSFVGADNKWVVEPGAFDIMIGNLSDSFTLK